MLNLKKTRMKKNLFLALTIISAFIFIAGVMCTIMGDDLFGVPVLCGRKNIFFVDFLIMQHSWFI